MKNQKEFLDPQKQLAYLINSSNLEIIPDQTSLLRKLENSYQEKRPLKIKLGIDPTAPDLHFGHLVCLNSFKRFQELGHQGILIIGGFTAQLGDPTGRNEARPPLNKEQVRTNSQKFLEQTKKILDLKKTEILDNSSWLDSVDLSQIIKISSSLTVNRLLSKDTFSDRLKEGFALYLHELFYPVLQGYDSSIIKADIEIGGRDQRFNILMGREIQKYFNQSLQVSLMTPLLVGLDGTKKMSKTSGNHIALSDSAIEIYGKTMSIPDSLILDWYQLILNYSKEQLSFLKKELDLGGNPRDLKMKLAREIIKTYSLGDSDLAEKDFINKFQRNKLPEKIPEFVLNQELKELNIIELLVLIKFASSRSEARRAISNRAIQVDQQKVSLESFSVKKGSVIQFGKKRFIRVV